MAEQKINLQKIFKDSKKVLTDPKGYYSSMPEETGITESIIKALIYGLIAGIFYVLWSSLNLTGIGTMAGGLLAKSGVMIILLSLLRAIIGLFVGGLVVLILSAICKGNTDYMVNIRVTASLMVIWPIQALLAFIGGISGFLGALVSLAIFIYSFYLLFQALIHKLQAKTDVVRVLVYVLGGLVVILMIIGFIARSCSRTMPDIPDEIEKMEQKSGDQEEADLSLYQQVMKYGGEELPVGNFDKWEKMKRICNELITLKEESDTTLRAQKAKIEEIFINNDCESYQEGYDLLKEGARMYNSVLDIGIRISAINTDEQLGRKKEMEKTRKKMISDLKQQELTQSDLKAFSEYKKVIGKSLGLIMQLPLPGE